LGDASRRQKKAGQGARGGGTGGAGDGDADDGGRVLVCAVVKCSYYNKLLRESVESINIQYDFRILKYLPSVFNSDGNYNISGLVFVSSLFGLSYFGLTRVLDGVSV
jgi:hypothetical protein